MRKLKFSRGPVNIFLKYNLLYANVSNLVRYFIRVEIFGKTEQWFEREFLFCKDLRGTSLLNHFSAFDHPQTFPS